MTPREISIKAILDHKLFCRYAYRNGNICCALGYAALANKCGNYKYYGKEFTKLVGFTLKERSKIVTLNDSGKFEEMKKYVRSLKK